MPSLATVLEKASLWPPAAVPAFPGKAAHALYRRLAPVVLPRLPGSSLHWAPPRRHCPTAREWVERHGQPSHARFTEIYPADQYSRVPAITTDPHPPLVFSSTAPLHTPAQGVAVLPGARIVGAETAIVAPDDRVLLDVSMHFAPYHYDIYYQWRPLPCHDIAGPVLVLAGIAGCNYCHWLHQMLPRLHLAQQAGWKNSDWAAVVVSPSQNNFALESAVAAGLPREKCLVSSTSLHLRGHPLVVPTLLPGGNTPRWVTSFVRDTFWRGPAPKPTRRIYISRRHASTRHVANESDLEPVLREFGFEILANESLSFLEQVEVFRAAEAMCGIHGAGLTNLYFCQPGAKVIEIYAPGYPEILWWAMASQSDLPYYFMLGEGPRRDYADIVFNSPLHQSDITVDPAKLRATFLAAGL